MDPLATLERTPTGDVGATNPTLSVAILRNYTIEAMVPLLTRAASDVGLTAQVTLGGYDTTRQEILDGGSHVHGQPPPDLVVLSLVLEYLDPEVHAAGWSPDKAREFVLGSLEDLLARTAATIIVSTLLPPLHTEDRVGALVRPDHRNARVSALNAEIVGLAQAHPHRLFVLDTGQLLQQLGAARSFDHRFGFMYRAPYTRDFLAASAHEIVKIGRLLKGRVKKCLVLDCDNTLWGGVVGEDGITGIALDPHDFPGRCYYEFQRTVVNLAGQGVAVALCSKNEDGDVWDVIDNHPHCLIKREHIAAWRINWSNKAENIAALARELNLGLDALVFVDDSKVECDLVRTLLPEVTVLDVPARPYDLPPLLLRDGWFDTLWTSDEDRARTAMYRQAQAREAAAREFGDITAYLSSLEVRATIRPATPQDLPRVAQLVARTNQFNLTTRRHTETAIAEFAASPDWAVMTLTAGDRFGDLGLVGVLIAERTGRVGRIDTLLLSCRALGRQLERAFVDQSLTRLEREWDIAEWLAEYLPTRKNAQTASFWQDQGFTLVAEIDGRKHYRADRVARRVPPVDVLSITAG